MDLYAYANIENLDELVRKNGIEVPRLRGYRLMKDEAPEDMNEIFDGLDVMTTRHLVHTCPFWSYKSNCSEYSGYTDWLEHYYIGKNENGEEYVLWENIHGWKRKELKTAIHNEKKKWQKQYEMWNKYAGKENILYIHARIGGWNWPHYYQEVAYQPWFLEKVDDAFDSTYCDIYARLELGDE